MALLIFKFIRNDQRRFNEYHELVVIAESETRARELAADPDWRDPSTDCTPWDDPGVWDVEEIGIAHPNQTEGVVVADYYEP